MASTSASVFDMSDFTVTRRLAQNYLDDVKVPIMEGVAKGSIDSPGFLTGITAGVAGNVNDGVYQTIIIGDQVEEIRGKNAAKVTIDRDVHIVGALMTKIDTFEDRKVDGKGRITQIATLDDLTVNGDRVTNIVKNDQLMVTGNAITTIISGEVKNVPYEFWKSTSSGLETFWARFNVCLFNGIICGLRFRASPVETKFYVHKSEYGIAEHKGQVFDVQIGLLKLVVKLAKMFAGGVKNWLFPVP